MDQFIDNLARELAKPTSRRAVIRLVGGAMLGSLVAAWKPASLQAHNTCSPKCKSGKKCCTTGHSPFCCNNDKVCCGNSHCPSGHRCCGGGPHTSCARPSEICCGKIACESDEKCCDNKACCSANQQCVHGCCVASHGKK